MSLHIEISIALQKLWLKDDDVILQEFLVSTAANGAGELQDSECTPRGIHLIGEKIGQDAPVNSVFVGRQATGEVYSPELRESFPGRDWILTRILWLVGCEPGKNQGGKVDSCDRYIYIHGTPDDVELGNPGSRGCIRMQNQDMIAVFDLVSEGTLVNILSE